MESGLIIGLILLGVVALYAAAQFFFPAPNSFGMLTVLERKGFRPEQPKRKPTGAAPSPPPTPNAPSILMSEHEKAYINALSEMCGKIGITETAVFLDENPMMLERVIYPKPIIATSHKGEDNGFLVPIWNVLEDDWRPDQVYLTAVYPNCVKGPHLHKKREGRFCCVFGDVKIVTRENGEYLEHPTGQLSGYPVVHVPPGVPAQIVNTSRAIALVLNMPSPAWSADDPDEWPVEGWDYGS